jgi:hypothetical protein
MTERDWHLLRAEDLPITSRGQPMTTVLTLR